MAEIGTTLPDLHGTVALVTGASGGGSGIARQFAAAGADVVLHYHTSRAAADALADELTSTGARVVTARADITDPGAVRGVDRRRRRHVRPSRRAGQQLRRPAGPATSGDDRAGLAGGRGHQPARHLRLHQAAVEVMRAGGGGAITQYGPLGIRVNTVSPGLIDREGLAEAWPDGVQRWRQAAPLGRLGRPTDIGNACVFLASPMAEWITGQDLVVDGGVSVHPTW